MPLAMYKSSANAPVLPFAWNFFSIFYMIPNHNSLGKSSSGSTLLAESLNQAKLACSRRKESRHHKERTGPKTNSHKSGFALLSFYIYRPLDVKRKTGGMTITILKLVHHARLRENGGLVAMMKTVQSGVEGGSTFRNKVVVSDVAYFDLHPPRYECGQTGSLGMDNVDADVPPIQVLLRQPLTNSQQILLLHLASFVGCDGRFEVDGDEEWACLRRKRHFPGAAEEEDKGLNPFQLDFPLELRCVILENFGASHVRQ